MKPSETMNAITNFLFIGKELQELGQYDLVLVLGNDDIKGTVNEILTLYSNKIFTQNCRIILSGNVGSINHGKPPEAERLFSELISAGMRKEMLFMEKRATNALENYRFSKDIIDSLGGFDAFSSILSIGKAFMMRRAKMSAVACSYPIGKMDFFGTVDRAGRNIGPDTWWETESACTRVMEEIGRISNYTIKGDISIL